MRGDPYGEPLRTDRARAFDLHRQRLRQGAMARPRFEAALAELEEGIAALLAGRRSGDGLRDLAEALGVAGLPPTDPRPVPRAGRLPSLAEMARIATDIDPSSGNTAPDRFLGPWADVLDAATADRRVLHTAVAASCFLPVDEDRHGRTPLIQWVRRKPHPPVEERERMRAVERAPCSAWRLLERTEAGWLLEDLVGLHRAPAGPVAADDPPSVDGAGAPGDTLLARVVSAEGGWHAVLPLVVRGCPGREQVRTWLEVESWSWRLDRKVPSLEVMMRDRPHVLVRRVHEWAWTHR